MPKATNADTVKPFGEIYTFAMFQQIADVSWWRCNDWDRGCGAGERNTPEYKEASLKNQADSARYKEHKTMLTSLLRAHLGALQAEGRLGLLSGLNGRRIAKATAWNNLVDGKEDDHQTQWLMTDFADILTTVFVQMDRGRHARTRADDHVKGTHVVPSEDQQRAAWETFCACIDSGLTSDDIHDGKLLEANDSKTGETVKIVFDNWQPTLMGYDAKYNMIELFDVDVMPLVTAQFPVPSGNLLLTDMLRHQPLNDALEFAPERDYAELSLNNADGRDKRTMAHAEEHGVAFAQTTNTVVNVYRSETTGILMVSGTIYDDETDEFKTELAGWKLEGTVNCDVWRIMAYDKQTAVNLCAQQEDISAEQAEADLDAYLASDDCYAENVLSIDVAPGTWSIHSGDRFNDRVDRAAYGLPDNVKVWCILQKS